MPRLGRIPPERRAVSWPVPAADDALYDLQVVAATAESPSVVLCLEDREDDGLLLLDGDGSRPGDTDRDHAAPSPALHSTS